MIAEMTSRRAYLVKTSRGVPNNVSQRLGFDSPIRLPCFAYDVQRPPTARAVPFTLSFAFAHVTLLGSSLGPAPSHDACGANTFPRVLTSFLASRRSRDSVVAGWNPSGRCRMPSVIIVPRGVSFSAPSSASSSGTLLGVGYSGRSGGAGEIFGDARGAHAGIEPRTRRSRSTTRGDG